MAWKSLVQEGVRWWEEDGRGKVVGLPIPREAREDIYV